MTIDIAIHWFRQDLRLSDNPALARAAAHGRVIPVYILDETNAGRYAMGGASRVWLHHSLTSLSKSLGGQLAVFKGSAEDVLLQLSKQTGAKAVYWNRCYEPWRMERDSRIKDNLRGSGIQVESENGSLLWEPWEITNKEGKPYRVFSPFYRKGCLAAPEPRRPLPKPVADWLVPESASTEIATLGLLPNLPWGKSITENWQIGEAAAQNRFDEFLNDGLNNYKEGRNLPAKPFVSRLSPHLHFGEVSPNQLWHPVRGILGDSNAEHFCSELGWREFSYSQLFHNRELPLTNLQTKFDAFPWRQDRDHLRAWQTGQTGIPIVDAGMRELWQTGYMHNRVRMIVGSFLVKNLLLDWRHGERWFWDCLFDADLANNSASWQWVAGCGADAAPYFRVFNPVTQGQKFDPKGEYTRKYLPELEHVPDKFLYDPWNAPALVLKAADVTLGNTYPEPIVDLKLSREAALAAFQSLKKT